MIEHGSNGILTPPGDVAALADAIARVLSNAGERQRLGAAARVTITHRYSSGNVADRWLEAYDLIPVRAR